MNKTATFIGHSECVGVDKNALKNTIISLIEKGMDTFYSGGMGNFDWLGARTVYELKEKHHFKSAIAKRNRYMVDNSDYAVCYVNHDCGGAAKTYEYAKKGGLTILDIVDCE